MQQWQCRLPVLLQALLVCSLAWAQPRLAAAAAHAAPAGQHQAKAPAAGDPAAAAAVTPPSFCTPAGESTAAAYPGAAGPTHMLWGGNMLKVYRNLYHHNKKWFAVVDASSNGSSIDVGISLNAQLVKLPTTDSEAFQRNLKVCYVAGVTLLIDFPFPAFPDNLGHWAELLLPLYSALSSKHLQQQQQQVQQAQQGHEHPDQQQQEALLLPSGRKYIDRLLLLNVRKELLYSWPREVSGLALNPALPPWPPGSSASTGDSSSTGSSRSGSGGSTSSSSSRGSASGTDSTDRSSSSSSGLGWEARLPWERPLPPIIGPGDYEAWCANGWLVFEAVVVPQDRYPIMSLPDEARPARPTPPGGSTTAAAAAAASTTAADADAAAVAAAATVDSGLWASPLVVGFATPELAARFRADALARHMWDRPWRRKQEATALSKQQQQQQQQGGGRCQAHGGSCVAPAAAEASQQTRSSGSSNVESDASSIGGGSSSNNGSSIPRTVTVLWYPEDYPPVTNHRQLVRLLEDITEPHGFKVRTVSLTMGAPFLSHMATMADTGILVGRHGPLLASAVLLPPGAAVLELLPYKWEWRGVSSLYYNMTQSTGRLHHWAWRPLDAKWCRYKQPSDARYAGWLPQECQGSECLLVHAQAGLEVDLVAVRQLLEAKLPGLVAGASVEALREPWPAAE